MIREKESEEGGAEEGGRMSVIFKTTAFVLVAIAVIGGAWYYY